MGSQYSKCLLLLLLLFASVHAFSVSDYLYSEENSSAVTTENFTANGINYTIVKIGGAATFLLRNGEVVQDKTNITAVLTPYYTSKYYPMQAKVDELKEAIVRYNASRNDGYLWPGKEEDACEDALFLSRRDLCAIGDVNCSARYFCSYLAPTGGCNSLEDQQKYMRYMSQFYNATSSTDSILAADINKLNTMDYSTVYAYLLDIKNTVATLRKNLVDIEGTLFRTPLNVSTCTDCMGQCPDIDLNDSALNVIETKAGTLANNTKPLGELPSLIDDIYENTATRLDYYTRGKEAQYYEEIFAPLRNKGILLMKDVNASLALVSDNNLKTKNARLENLTNEIDEKIANRNLTDINTSLEEYKILLNGTRILLDNNNNVYSMAKEAKGNVSALLFMLSTKTLNDNNTANYNTLKSKVTELDNAFVPGLTAAQYEDITKRYINYTWQAKGLLESTTDNTGFIGAIKDFSRRTNNGLNYLIMKYAPLSYQEREQWARYIPAIFAIMVFLAFFSLLLYVAFQIYILNQRLFARRIAYLGFVFIFLLLTFGVAVKAAVLYYFSDQITNHADFSEFQKMIYTEKNVNILLEEKDVPQATVASMESCALLVKDVIGTNKTITIYKMFDGDCSYDSKNTTRDDCMARLNGTIIVFRYSALDLPPSFTAVFDRRAIISGDKKQFDACPLATAFRW